MWRRKVTLTWRSSSKDGEERERHCERYIAACVSMVRKERHGWDGRSAVSRRLSPSRGITEASLWVCR